MATQTGYKVSELCMIPQNWDVVELGDVFEVTAGGDLDVTNFSTEKTHKHIYPIYSNAITDNGLYGFSSNYDCCGNHITVTARGYIGYAVPRNGKFSSIGRLLTLKPKTEISCYLVAQYINQFVSFAIESTGVPQLTAPQIKKYLVAIPKSTTEQTAIATVLSDTDALISSLQTLIAKKQAIKLSAMQNLLSGKIRLPEFALLPDGSPKTMRQTELGCVPEDWEIGTIGKDCVLKARIGWQSLRTDEYLESGEYGLITGTDFNNGLVDWKTCSFVSEWRYKQDTNIQLKVNDVLITKDGTIGKLGYINELPFSATLNSGIYVIRPKNSNLIEPMFLFYLFSSEYFNDFISVISAGSTITHLYQKDFVNFQFPLPSKTEQTAIAQLLSDMDAEIEALECRLKKTQSLKQGMMQALLTGKIRLPLE
ncbi:restriction endonuclease subunit S [Neisseria elongata]|mgnify:CR=1 FL=1|uniref:restriction endonuclease subunit S n=1 Tax=Neisseria elongata TaxID=495 RepID=UPI00069EFE14|nr:restriction endonuclease subunit S [Neisseria elongata]